MQRIWGTPRGIAERLRRDVREQRRDADHGRRGEDEVPRQGRERRGQARRAARRAARRRAGVPPPAARRAAVGRRAGDGAQAPRARDRDRRQVAALAEATLVRCSGAPRAGTCTHSPTTATRGRCRSAAGGARSARSARSGARRRSPAAIDAALVALVDRVTRRMRAARRVGRTVVLRLRFDDFSRATRSHTLPRATADTGTILATARGLLAGADAADRAPGHHARGRRGHQPRRRARVQLALPFDATARARSTRPSTRCATRFGIERDHARRAARPRPGHRRCRCCPIEAPVAPSAA